jgi:hypothetical protein
MILILLRIAVSVNREVEKVHLVTIILRGSANTLRTCLYGFLLEVQTAARSNRQPQWKDGCFFM